MTLELLQMTIFTLAVALAATASLLVPGTLLAWMFARTEFSGKALLETAVSLPLVMPPVATGLILLWVFGTRGPLGGLGFEIIFTWKAVVLAMAVMGLPLLVRTARPGFEQVPRRYELMAESLGAGRLRVFRTVNSMVYSTRIVDRFVINDSKLTTRNVNRVQARRVCRCGAGGSGWGRMPGYRFRRLGVGGIEPAHTAGRAGAQVRRDWR